MKKAIVCLFTFFLVIFPSNVKAANYGSGNYGDENYGTGDTTSPSGGSIEYSNGYVTTASVALLVADGTDSGSGIDTATRIFQRNSAPLTNGSCGTYLGFGAITPTGTYPNFIDNTVSSGKCYQYKYQVSDASGNQVTYTSSNIVKVDTSSPSAPGSPVSSPTSPTNQTSQTWSWTAATDAISGIASYAWRTTGSVISSGVSLTNSVITSLTEGIYNFFVKGLDLAGNYGSESTGSLTVDTTAPTGGSISYTNGYFTTASVALTVDDGTDSGSGIDTTTRIVQRKSATLTVDTCGSYGSFGTISPTGTYPNFTDSTVVSGNCYQYKYLTSDNAANQAVYVSSNTAKVDTVAPDVTINQAAGQADPTNNSPINYTVVFTKPVSDFATGDLNLTGTAGATTGTVTGSGTTYNVAVSGMTGSGTVIASIAANKAHDVAGNANNSSTSLDNSVTYSIDAPILTSITISDSSGFTSSATPTIAIVSSGSPTNVAFSCNGGSNWSSWIAYADNISTFNITSGATGCTNSDGSKTIKAKLKDVLGNESDTVSDTTYYDTTAPTLAAKTSFSGWYTADQTSTFTYTDSSGSGIVSGIPVTCDITNEGSAQTCSITPNVCDLVGNCNTTQVTSNGANIDTTAPTGGSISYTNGYFTTSSVALTVDDGTDSGSGIDTASRTFQRQTANLILGVCGIYGDFSPITPTPNLSYPNFIDTTVVSGNCYKYQYQISDSAGNQTTYTIESTARIDTSNPSDPGTPSTTTPTSSTSQTWTWIAASDAISDIANYLWRTTGTTITSGTSSIASVVTNLAEGVYNFFVKAVDNAGNQGTESFGTLTVDATAPIISSVSAGAIASTEVVVIWTTNENSSSKVEYGLTASYGNSSSEIDTTTPVKSHSVDLSNLVACTTYHYRVISKDAALNEKIDDDHVFTTSGCTASSTVTVETSAQITAAAGGSLVLLDENSYGLTLIIPTAFAESDANFQAHQLDKSTILSITSTPNEYFAAGSYFYELKALADVSTTLSVFSKSLTVKIAYGADDILGLDESTLKIYSWNGSVWNQGDACVVNTVDKTVTCTTAHFSTFGLFGQEIVVPTPTPTPTPTHTPTPTPTPSPTAALTQNDSSSSNSSSGNSNNSAPSCNDPVLSAPRLFQADVKGNSAKLFFTPLADTNKFFISYSTNSNAEEHSVEVELAIEGVQSYTINALKPNTTYYFKVRAQNGCMPGKWSNIIKVTSKFAGVTKTISYYMNSLKTKTSSFFQAIKITKIKKTQETLPKTVVSKENVIDVTPTPKILNKPGESKKTTKKFCILWWCW